MPFGPGSGCRPAGDWEEPTYGTARGRDVASGLRPQQEVAMTGAVAGAARLTAWAATVLPRRPTSLPSRARRLP